MGKCAYPGDILSYECTAEGGVITVWMGSALDILCEQPSYSLMLLHSRFSNGTAQMSCGNDSIVALGEVDNNTYTSHVNITASCELNGTTIQCIQDDGITESVIGNSTITGKVD